jgi:hypothetical protein
LANAGRYQIVTCSGVVVHGEGNVTGTGLRIASASAAIVVSAAVAGGALVSGSAISDPGAPIGKDQRLVAVPATHSPSPMVTPNGAITRSDPIEQERSHINGGPQAVENNHHQDRKLHTETDQEADPGSKVDTIYDSHQEFVWLRHQFCMGVRGAG